MSRRAALLIGPIVVSVACGEPPAPVAPQPPPALDSRPGQPAGSYKDPDGLRGALPDEAARRDELRAIHAHVDSMYAHRAAKLARYHLDEAAIFADAERSLLAATTWAAYDAAIYNALARFHDDHLTYHPPITARPQRGYTSFHLGLDTVLARDHLLVTAVEADSDAARAGVAPGDEVIAIDGRPTADVIAAAIKHRVYSRPEAGAYSFIRTWTHVLVPKGDRPRAREIRVRRRADGSELAVSIVPRESHERREHLTGSRDGDVAIVTIRSMSSRKDAGAIDDALAAARAAKAIVIDLRGVGGGEVGSVGPHVVAGLAEGTATLATYRVLVAPETLAQRPRWRNLVAGPDGFSAPQTLAIPAQPAGKGFHGALAVVIDAGCASTCEVVAGALRGDLHAILVGEQTAASSGGPVDFELPVTHGKVRIPSWDLVSADGHPIEDDGVLPDLPAVATPDALAAGVDLPLKTAIDAVARHATP